MPAWWRQLFRLPFFVGRGTIKPRNRDVVKPEIDAQLRRMVNQVIEAHEAEGHGAGVIGDDVLTKAKLPKCRKMLVAGICKGGPAPGRRLIEALQASLPRGEGKIGLRAFSVCHVHSVVLD